MKTKPIVLCVDDELNVLKSYQRALRNEPYTLVVASSGAEALAAFTQNPAVLVISDFRMPGMNGVELLDQIKKTAPETICVILSGYADELTIDSAIRSGAIAKFILKPIENDVLRQEIKTLLAQK